MAQTPNQGARPQPRLSLIVCTVNRLAPLERLLRSLRAQTVAPIEILIVDQNPANYLGDLLRRHQDLPLVHVVDLAEERGLSRARNLGLAHARGAVVGFPDDDCWYGPEVVAQVVRRFEDGAVDLVAGRTTDRSGAESVSAHLPRAAAITRENVFHAGNSNGLFVRRSLAMQVAGFDETLGVGAPTPFQSGEETDFVLRCLGAGAVCRFEPDLVVHHDRIVADAPAELRRVTRYAPGYGRVLRQHRYGAGHLAGRVLRSAASGALSLARGRAGDGRRQFAWAVGAARGYLAAPTRIHSTPPRSLPHRSTAGAAPAAEGRRIFGLRFSMFDEQQLVTQLTTASVPRGAGPQRLATANLDHIVQMDRNAAFRQAYDRAWAITADGMPVYLYARLRAIKLPSRVTGSDLFVRLVETLQPSRHRCFLVCSTDEVAQRLLRRFVERGFSREALAFCVPPYAFEADPAYSDALAARIRAHAPTHLFVGVGSPKSDLWTDRYRAVLGDCYVLNIGAALDFCAGTKRRAPVFLRRIGFEWAWRVAQEPRRLYRRYFVDSWKFLWLVALDLLRPGRNLAGGVARQAGPARDT